MAVAPAFSFASAINIVAIGQALILALVYIRRRKQIGLSGLFLITLLLVFSFDLFHDMLIYTRYFYRFPYLLGLGSAFTYLKGPLIFFYVLSYLQPEIKLRPVHALHLLPFLYKHLEAWPTYAMRNVEKIAFLDSYYSSLDAGQVMTNELVSLYSIIWHLHPLVYLVLSIYLIRKGIGGVLAPKKSRQLQHILYIIMAYSLIWLLNVSTYYLSGSVAWLHGYYWEFATFISSLAIIALAYSGLKDAPLYLSKTSPKPKGTDIPKHKALLALLEKELAGEKAYLDPELSLPGLAQRLSTTTHQLSELLNQHLQLTFFDYVNQYRVDEAKRLIAAPESARYTLEATARAAGFNSSASFYRAFKKFTGTTPAQFKKGL